MDSIEITARGDAIAMTRAGDDWKLTRPLAARADSSMVVGLISRVESSQMKSIVTTEVTPADLKKYGLDKPSVSVTLNLGSAKATCASAKAGEDAIYARDASDRSLSKRWPTTLRRWTITGARTFRVPSLQYHAR